MDYKEAIARMRELTARDEHFSFAFKTYSQEYRSGGETRVVENATLRSKPRKKDSNIVDPDLLLEFYDWDINENRHCYQHLLISFNGEPIEL